MVLFVKQYGFDIFFISSSVTKVGRFFVNQISAVARSVYRQSHEKCLHFSLYVQNISGYRRKKKKELKIPK